MFCIFSLALQMQEIAFHFRVEPLEWRLLHAFSWKTTTLAGFPSASAQAVRFLPFFAATSTPSAWPSGAGPTAASCPCPPSCRTPTASSPARPPSRPSSTGGSTTRELRHPVEVGLTLYQSTAGYYFFDSVIRFNLFKLGLST